MAALGIGGCSFEHPLYNVESPLNMQGTQVCRVNCEDGKNHVGLKILPIAVEVVVTTFQIPWESEAEAIARAFRESEEV